MDYLKAQLEKDESSYRFAIQSTKPIVFKPSSDNSRFVAEFFKVTVKYPKSSNKILKDLYGYVYDITGLHE